MRRRNGAAVTKEEGQGETRFTEYYRDIVEDVEALVRVMKEPLPCTFRVVDGVWRKMLEKKIAECTLIRKAKWHPQVYEIPLSRKDLSARGVRENTHGVDPEELEKAHGFMKQYFAGSYITRQETVSMIPVLALDVAKDSVVLDLCASPGSKSSQILEMLGPEGVIVCNDMNRRRIDLLVTQTKRFGHPGLVVTCCDGTAYPKSTVRPDRVLCDVPCSGDGTIRKNGHILPSWHMREALGLHSIQKKLLARGLDMLQPGGVLVYSTCSLNPVENELVVLSVLSGRADVELVPFDIPGLVMREGVSREALKICVEKADLEKKSSWPEYAEGIRHTRRVFPQDQNTGGFYIAKIRKLGSKDTRAGEEQACGKASRRNAAPLHETGGEEGKENALIRGEPGIEESYFYKVGGAIRARIEQEWGGTSLMLVSKTDCLRVVYGVSEKAAAVLCSAPSALRISFAGARLFSIFTKDAGQDRCKDKWRVSYEGLRAFIPKEEKRVVLPLSECCQVFETSQHTGLQERGVSGMLVLSPAVKGKELGIHIPVLASPKEISIQVDLAQRASLAGILKAMQQEEEG
ncbi:tRNA (cytosine34-C5)-methyltransferase [Nematocida sp. AWRm77]|nr:tRNA (cytosine34-C5)-methyltransferase [Nematocida sp. AWRm77]